MPPWFGHRAGAKRFEEFLNWCLELNISYISAYVLSTENIQNRSKREVNEIFKICYKFLKRWEKEGTVLDKYEVKVRFCGDLGRLPPRLVKLIGRIMQKTAKYQKKVINVLIAYGGKFELTQAFKKLAEKVIQTGRIEITPKDIEQNLLVPIPVDLVIRTGGHTRLSNFLLWQTAYAEIYVTETLWPDFTKEELIKAIKWFNEQERKFGR
jgi:tritrans,polycis-undecaprenyl-diphosphate synthase [geranylgeranyl-diphosphate specific]